jgi:hypothetical protein
MRQIGLAEVGASIAICFVLAVIATKLMERPPTTPRSQFREAAIALGITEAKHQALREDFEQTTILMDREPCNDSYRRVAGQAAVAYYETLLERPFMRAKLEMTQRSVCAVKINGKATTHTPHEPLSFVQAFQNGLRLPWDCMPDEWQTPPDLALQAKLELNIKTGRLTSDALTGTLGLLASSWEGSVQARNCEPTASRISSSSSRGNIPLLAAPKDSWDGGGRRRRY